MQCAQLTRSRNNHSLEDNQVKRSMVPLRDAEVLSQFLRIKNLLMPSSNELIEP
jgi:hypothetical protein